MSQNRKTVSIGFDHLPPQYERTGHKTFRSLPFPFDTKLQLYISYISLGDGKYTMKKENKANEIFVPTVTK